MISEPTPNPALPPSATATASPGNAPRNGRLAWFAVAGVSVVALAASGMLWQKVANMQEQLARQSADAGALAAEARSLARKADELSRETAARMSVNDTRLSEVALQRGQLEDLMQSLSRSRDENLVVDIDSGLRLAQQQAALTSSAQPLLAALQSASQRIERAAQPRLAPLQRAIDRDAERVKNTNMTDVPGLLARIDELIRLVDDLPTINAVAQAGASSRFTTSGADKSHGMTAAGNNSGNGSNITTRKIPAGTATTTTASGDALPWWRSGAQRVWTGIWDEARGLVRVSRIDQPEAALVSPEQSFFLRENLKHQLVNARLGVLARQTDSAHADLTAASGALGKYFDAGSKRVQAAVSLMQQVTVQTRSVELPRIDDTLAALATAAAGR